MQDENGNLDMEITHEHFHGHTESHKHDPYEPHNHIYDHSHEHDHPDGDGSHDHSHDGMEGDPFNHGSQHEPHFVETDTMKSPGDEPGNPSGGSRAIWWGE